MNGMLLIDKPLGWTSFDVVAKVRGQLRQAKDAELSATSYQPSALTQKVKVGHTGTLDPLATGLLVLVVGNYCKRAGEFSKLDKTYEVTMTLGATSATGDAEGEITPVSDKEPSNTQINSVIQQFIGQIEQIPPAYSAIKVNGQRAYKLARAGKEPQLDPRIITIHAIASIVIDYPEVRFTARVSSGTYIRSLVEDIGETLGTGAYMSGLRRTTVGEWDVIKALTMPDISAESLTNNLITL
ncbi:MAG: tRNA pseudouridine(55) synthase TruB [Patescibacteria group bacterium]